MNLTTFAQNTITINGETTTLTSSESVGILGFFAGLWLLWLAYIVFSIIAGWKIFEKAEEEGWKILIPFYNTYTLFRIAGRNGWGFLLMLIPIVNLFVALMIAIDLAKHYGKSTMFGVIALFLFQPIGMLILGFGDSKYVGTKHE